ncbi:MAG TPA: hypothetical protein VEB40_05600, partial [Flavipsychrobacter sp.]|nr:hypothetical protein [Flavipsychrobacter sp.]
MVKSLTRSLLAFLLPLLILQSEKSLAQCTATLTVNATSSCQDSTFILTATPAGLYDYQWFINGNLGPLGIETWNYYAFQPGTYTFEVQITDFNNCTVISNPVTITVYPNPNVQGSSNGPVCPGNTLQLASSSNTGTSYTWTGPNGFTSSSQNPTLSNFQAINAGTYTVFSTYNGCNSHPDHFQVDTVSSTPSITAILNQYYGYQNSICEGESFSLSTTITGFSSGSLTWTGPNNYTSSNNLNFINNSTVA